MIEFVICDDDKKFLFQVENIINKVMLKKNIEYDIKKNYDFDKKFLDIVATKENQRIYILDIETPSCSGIRIGKIIRKSDMESPIIFLTGHEELGNVLLRKDINFFAFINKFEGFESRLKKCIDDALTTLNKKQFLEIRDKKVCYRFSFQNILYITRDSISRKTIIYTDNNVHGINKTLTEISNNLDDRFIQTHRSCFINKDRVVQIDNRKKQILFDTGIKIDMVSSNYKIEDYVDVN